MTGRAEIKSLTQRLDATFERVHKVLGGLDPENQADYARYLCVLVSGYLERAVCECLIEHARKRGDGKLQRFVEIQLGRFANAKAGKIIAFLDQFDTNWSVEASALLSDQKKDAVDSIVSTRHLIAHGRSVGITYAMVKQYYDAVKDVVTELQNICGI